MWRVSNWLIFRLIINFYFQLRKMGIILCTGTEHSATSSLLAKCYCLCQQSSLLIKHWFIIIYSSIRLFCPHISYCADTNLETFFKEIFVSMFSKHDYWEILRRNMWIFWEIRSLLCLWVRLALHFWLSAGMLVITGSFEVTNNYYINPALWGSHQGGCMVYSISCLSSFVLIRYLSSNPSYVQ